jgi:hypothetical protein
VGPLAAADIPPLSLRDFPAEARPIEFGQQRVLGAGDMSGAFGRCGEVVPGASGEAGTIVAQALVLVVRAARGALAEGGIVVAVEEPYLLRDYASRVGRFVPGLG